MELLTAHHGCPSCVGHPFGPISTLGEWFSGSLSPHIDHRKFVCGNWNKPQRVVPFLKPPFVDEVVRSCSFTLREDYLFPRIALRLNRFCSSTSWLRTCKLRPEDKTSAGQRAGLKCQTANCLCVFKWKLRNYFKSFRYS